MPVVSSGRDGGLGVVDGSDERGDGPRGLDDTGLDDTGLDDDGVVAVGADAAHDAPTDDDTTTDVMGEELLAPPEASRAARGVLRAFVPPAGVAVGAARRDADAAERAGQPEQPEDARVPAGPEDPVVQDPATGDPVAGDPVLEDLAAADLQDDQEPRASSGPGTPSRRGRRGLRVVARAPDEPQSGDDEVEEVRDPDDDGAPSRPAIRFRRVRAVTDEEPGHEASTGPAGGPDRPDAAATPDLAGPTSVAGEPEEARPGGGAGQPSTLVITSPAAPPGPPASPDDERQRRPPLWQRLFRGGTDGPDVLDEQLRAQVDGPRTITVASGRGGQGTTTLALLLGAVLADARRDRVVVVDADALGGSMADRLLGDPVTTELAAFVRAAPERWADVRAMLHTTSEGLDVLAAPTVRGRGRQRDTDVVERAVQALQHHYSLVVLDAGCRAATHNTIPLALADTLVLATTAARDAVRATGRALDAMAGSDELVELARASVLVVAGDDVGDGVDELSGRVGSTHRLPNDRHLAAGAALQPDQLDDATRRAVRQVSAAAVEQLRRTAAT